MLFKATKQVLNFLDYLSIMSYFIDFEITDFGLEFD